jgi:anti-anti-sigma factor
MSLSVHPTSARADGSRRSALTTLVRDESAGTALVLRGEADSFTAPVLADALSAVAASRSGDVVIDLAEVDFLDTAAVQVLSMWQEVLDRQRRTLTFRSPSRLAALVLDYFGLRGVIEAVRVEA